MLSLCVCVNECKNVTLYDLFLGTFCIYIIFLATGKQGGRPATSKGGGNKE